MRVALLLVVVVGCANQGERQSARWPDHRKQGERRITALEEQVKELDARLAALEARPRGVAPTPAAVSNGPPVIVPPDPPPPQLDRDMISHTIEPLLPAIRACSTGIPTRGTVKLSVRVEPDGHVADAAVLETPDKLLGQCVADLVHRATFPQTVVGGRFSYPFVY
jgi:hypothetical protein